MKTTTLSKENLARISKLAGPFVDDVNIVVGKLLDYWDQRKALPQPTSLLSPGRLSDKYRFIFVSDSGKRLAPQAEAIINIVRNSGKEGITRLDLIEEMKRQMPARQPHSRILAFYQRKLIEEARLKLQKA